MKLAVGLTPHSTRGATRRPRSLRATAALAAAVAVGAVIAGLGALPASAIPGPCGGNGVLSGTNECTYTVSGEGTFNVPAGISSIEVLAVGADGQAGFIGGGIGGSGATIRAITPASGTVYVEVGVGGGAGGFYGGGQGGGLSGVYSCSGATNTGCALVVAAGGGGGGHYGQPAPTGGWGGSADPILNFINCTYGGNGYLSHGIFGTSNGGIGATCFSGSAGGSGPGLPGSAGSAGQGGVGGNGTYPGAQAGAGGGGAGYYGGGGGGGGTFAGGGYSGGGGGGAGSSYISPSAIFMGGQATGGAPASVTIKWTYPDHTAPVITAPPVVVHTTTPGQTSAVATFSPSATDDTDGSVPVSCDATSGASFPLGVTTVTCSATDASFNTATASFPVTVTAVAFTSVPAPTITVQNPSIQFGAAYPTRYTCSLDGAPSSACSSPKNFSGLAAGPHTFCSQATLDVTPLCTSWTIASPGKPVASASTVSLVGQSWTVTFSSDQAGSRFQCSIDGSAFAACSPARTYNGLGLHRSHTFSVVAVNFAGDMSASPATISVTIP